MNQKGVKKIKSGTLFDFIRYFPSYIILKLLVINIHIVAYAIYNVPADLEKKIKIQIQNGQH